MNMESIQEFYLRRIIGRHVGEDVDFYTIAYKYGIAKDAATRDTRGDFLKSANAAPSQAMYVPVKFELKDVESLIVIAAPQSFILSLENFCKDSYYKKDKKFFANKSEFIHAHEESFKKTHELQKILQKQESRLDNLKKGFVLLKDDQPATINIVMGNYASLLEEVTSHLRAFSDPLSKVNNKTAAVPAVIQAVTSISSTLPSGKKHIEDYLAIDFILYKSGTRLYLQHKEYHKDPVTGKMKDPTSYKGSWVTDTVNCKEPKFQFHSNSVMSQYSKVNVSVKTVLKAFNEKNVPIIDLDAIAKATPAKTNGVSANSN